MNWLKFAVLTVTLASLFMFSGCKALSRLRDGSGVEYLVFVETSKPDKDAVLSLAAKAIESSMDSVGIDGDAMPDANRPGHLRIKVYGQNDSEVVKRLLFTTHDLALKKLVSPPAPEPIKTYSTQADAANAAAPGQEVLPYDERSGDGPKRYVIAEAAPILTGEDVAKAQAYNADGRLVSYSVSFTLRPDGAARFSEWTSRNINNYLAVVLDGSVVSAAYIKSQMSDQGVIDGAFTKAAAEELAVSLSRGYLPARLVVVEEKPFGR